MLHPAQQMFLINYKTPYVKGSYIMNNDSSVVTTNTCPTSIISESSKEEMDCSI